MVEDTSSRKMHGFERLLSLWVFLCMGAGILLGRVAPGFARALDGITIDVDGAPVVSIPIAVCLFFMMYPIMVKIDFTEVVAAGKSTRPVLLTLFVNWCVKPFTMLGISSLFLGTLFLQFIGPEATDLVRLPFGLDLPEGATYGAGTVVVAILGESWPEWLSLVMAGVFMAVGYAMIIVTLNNYQKIVNRLQIERKLNVMSPRLTIFLTAILQVALVIVLGLFILGLFSESS